jgi:hypothetical protein
MLAPRPYDRRFQSLRLRVERGEGHLHRLQRYDLNMVTWYRNSVSPCCSCRFINSYKIFWTRTLKHETTARNYDEP